MDLRWWFNKPTEEEDYEGIEFVISRCGLFGT